MSLGRIVTIAIVTILLFVVHEIWYFIVTPNRLAKAEPYKVYGHDWYGPDKNEFNCRIVIEERYGKIYYRISWKAANGFWQPDYKPLRVMIKLFCLRKKKTRLSL